MAACSWSVRIPEEVGGGEEEVIASSVVRGLQGGLRPSWRGRGEYVLLLNPDTVVGEDVFRKGVDLSGRHGPVGARG